ncbi:MAG: lipid A biosynthesis acyltransferase [Gallionellales bacterium RIFCSPLOWO2_02_FULL_57_47]|nr:MAG: lipid A biosynthesis acyltransferase [Gallionellales bacterium RIFCSPLOWO2_02_FULL_57_47]OGT14943.1 MAG: lipid A biosynthesis acyltransferase [Gallionellales bacterium RIFCSPHIGHO2_02_FULL_57_16]
MTYFIVNLIFRLIALLPLRTLHLLGTLVGHATFAMSRGYAARTEENLRQSHLATDEKHFAALLEQTISEAGKGMVELPWVWSRPLEQVCATVQSCQGWEHMEAAHARGKGIILLTPHWGCFEVVGLYIGQRMPLTCLYRSPRQDWLEKIMRAGRERGLAKLATADVSGVRVLYKALRRGEAIGLLPDQVPSQGEGEWVDFFARPAYTMTLSGRLAQSSGATVLLAFAERLPRGAGYALRIEPLPLDFSKPVPPQINAALERVIAISPAQYLWSYNRYKIPSGAVLPETTKEQPC